MLKRVLLFMVCTTTLAFAQKDDVKWLTFEELELKLAENPKKVMIYIYADWCVYCKKMDQSVFSRPEIKALLSSNYYAVRFNAEYKDTVWFGGQTFINRQLGKRRNPYHEITEFLIGRSNTSIELPATVFLNENFDIEKRFYRYISPEEMRSILISK